MMATVQPGEDDPKGIGDVLDRLIARTGGDQVSVGDVLDAFGTKAFGPLVLVPALLLTLPTGIVPGVPLVLGAVILIVSVQVLFGARAPWVPARLRRVRVGRERLVSARRAAAPWLARIDALIRPRAGLFVRPPMTQAIALVCVLLSVSLVPVEIIPFATALPGSALILFGLALTAHDGLLALGGLAGAAATGGFLAGLL
ncbi:MAG: exopolysaccharide biosynthesis protein [Alphaproteobacteria bacterium]|nr:exopolysaccharide biosynthesis protein [Alphaproteobacteria bacterium]